MQPKCLRVWLQRPCLEYFHVIRVLTKWWLQVVRICRKLVIVLNGLGADIFFQHCVHAAAVPVVSDASTVVDVTRQLDNDLERNKIILVQKLLELAQGAVSVAVTEIILDIPTKRPKFASFLHHSVEPTQRKAQALVWFDLCAALEHFVIETLECANHICL